jgi:hypothetical protein
MEFLKRTIYLTPDDTGKHALHLTPIGDIHAGSVGSNAQVVKHFMDQRTKLLNHTFLGNGDMVDAIMPTDERFTGTQKMYGDDAVIDRMIEEMAGKYEDYSWLAMLQGNHENKVARKYYSDPIGRVCALLGVPYLRYSAQIFLSCRSAKTRKTLFPLRLLVHHGAWTGHVNAGFTGAMRWAQTYPGWDVLIYGHSHQCFGRPIAKREMSTNGNIREYNAYVVNTGTFLRTEVQGATTYSERRGYPRAYIGAPLIKISKHPGSGNYPKIRVEV